MNFLGRFHRRIYSASTLTPMYYIRLNRDRDESSESKELRGSLDWSRLNIKGDRVFYPKSEWSTTYLTKIASHVDVVEVNQEDIPGMQEEQDPKEIEKKIYDGTYLNTLRSLNWEIGEDEMPAMGNFVDADKLKSLLSAEQLEQLGDIDVNGVLDLWQQEIDKDVSTRSQITK